MKLIASRHGETVWNTENRLMGRESDSPLTPKGREQAQQLGVRLRDKRFDAVYSSPLLRAVTTAQIALGGQYKICLDDRLAEIGLGVLHGMAYEQAAETFPCSGMLFFTDPVSYRPPAGAEPLPDMIERVNSFLNEIIQKEYETVYLQTHGYVLRVLYACTEDKTVEAIARSPGYSNCDLACYTYTKGKWISE